MLEIGKEFSWDTAHLPENKPKNRYANIVACKTFRLLLFLNFQIMYSIDMAIVCYKALSFFKLFLYFSNK